MRHRLTGLVFTAALVTACVSTPTPTDPPPGTAAPSEPAAASPSTTSTPMELTSGELPSGTYTRTGFVPPIAFAIDDGWATGTLTDGFFDVQQNQGTPDVIAVQFALVEDVVGTGGSMVPATTAADAVAAIKENPGLVVFGESGSLLGGREGLTVEVENQGATTSPIMRVQPGTLAFDPQRRLWISLFDTADGLLAVMVGGSVAEWDRALTEAEPVLESVIIGGG
jgi:hypothetical protein